MNIRALIREQKEKVRARRVSAAQENEEQAKKELADYQAIRRGVEAQAAVRAERSKLKELKRQEFSRKLESVTGFFNRPTVAAAKAKRSSNGRIGYRVEPNPAFGLGSGQNPAFGLGSPKRSAAPAKKRKGVTIIVR